MCKKSKPRGAPHRVSWIASAVLIGTFATYAVAEDSSTPEPADVTVNGDSATESPEAAPAPSGTAPQNSPRRRVTADAPSSNASPSIATHLPKADESATSSGTATTQAKSAASSSSAASSKAALTPAALPVGGDKSGVTTKSLSIPKGAGSIEGMGESFSTQLSTGVATFSVPFALPKARGAAQPSLGLSYNSSSGQGVAGLGWDVGVPFIARQTDRGLPSYDDQVDWQANQDRFVYNGGQELVPICTVGAGLSCSGAIKQNVTAGSNTVALTEEMPAWSQGWQYFRPRVEGGFLRFFWSPNHNTWRVQDKNGVTLELGVPLDDATYLDALDRNADSTNTETPQIYRWHLVRQYDAYGNANAATGAAPVNMAVYRYVQSGGQALLSDIYATPPVSGSGGLGEYAHHVHLSYEARTDPTVSYRSGWRIELNQRLVGVDVTTKAFNGVAGEGRKVVRRYHLGYAAGWHQSLLESVQVEGRCGTNGEDGADSEGANGLLAVTACPRLPAMIFSYQHVQPFNTAGKQGVVDLEGYEGFDERIQVMAQTPAHSLDEQLTDLFDVNSDSLPDLLVTAPGVYGQGHGVFFNGVGGLGGFGSVAKMAVNGVNGADASTITLRNLNVSTLDVDGDGRVNFLHMPMLKTYAVYDAVGSAGNWRWVGQSIDVATRQNPKIDFGSDAADIQVVDINFDGLVDVLYSSGTELKTFFALGRYPGGNYQFGNATWTGAFAASISNDPVSHCIPYAGLPIRLSDKETKLADMNGDGIVDLVKLQRGQIRYWPGRGNGFFGTGRRDNCKAGTFGDNRYEEMVQSPQYSDIQGDSLRLDDVNGDGLSDLVQIRYDAVDVWLNVDGKGWTQRHIIDGSPYSPSYAARVRLTDINGSGTPDVLWGDAEKFQYMDLTGGKKPGLLVAVANGLGKTTAIEYSTSAEEMLAAEAHSTCPDSGIPPASDAWSYAWCKKMPTVAHVVKRVAESDNLIAAGQGPSSIVTEYDYRDPVYEGRQREFRGFERTRSRRLGDDNSPTDVSESWFLLGECQDLTPTDSIEDCSNAERWRDNPMEALKGLPYVTEQRDLSGRTLSTDVTNYELHKLYDGRDGRTVRHAVAVGKSSYVYDTSETFSGGAAVPTTIVETVELVAGSGGVPSAGAGSPVISRSIATRSSAVSVIQSATLIDFFGNQVVASKLGCTAGCADTLAGVTIAEDEVITNYALPTRVTSDNSRWIFRTAESWTTGDAHGANRYGYQKTTYDAYGNPTQIDSELLGSVNLTRTVDAQFTRPADGAFTASNITYDAFGNPTRAIGANSRCTDVGYDTIYGQLPTSEKVFKSAGCTGDLTVQALAYDRGLGLITIAIDMNNQPTKVDYDEFGRTKTLYKPRPDSAAISTDPSIQIEYFLPPSLGPNLSAIHTMTEDGAVIGSSDSHHAWAFIDGLGRTRTTLSEADPAAGDGGNWVVSGLVTHDAKGAVQRKHVEYFYTGSPETFAIATPPATPYGSQRYDAFGRAVQTFDVDGTLTLKTLYHALGSDQWDAADLSSGPHAGTYASERKDGHGRTIRATQRAHAGTSIETSHVLTEYSPTGQPEVIRHRLGSTNANDIVRWMRYDSLGRMVLNYDPHASNPSNTAPPAPTTPLAGYARPTGLKTWVYYYNQAGDLLGTEDARGCGANFGYDAIGRLLGEDYVPCGSILHKAYSTPTGPDAGWEVVYFYDAAPTSGTQVPPAICNPNAYANGRLVTVRDRAAETTTCIDGRGRTVATARRIGSPADSYEFVSDTPSARYTSQFFYKKFAYDAADRVVYESVGGQQDGARNEFDAAAQGVFKQANNPSAADAQDKQVVRTNYTARGTVKNVEGSYGTLVDTIVRRADGLVTYLKYGDSAGTATATTYDDRRRPASVQTYRGASALWTAFAPGGSGMTGITYTPAPNPADPTTHYQLLLEDTDIAYDEVGNPVEIRDWREPLEWPASAKPNTRKIEYDDLYRTRRVDYLYATSTGTDSYQSPFNQENTESTIDARRAKPAPHLKFDSRPIWQRYEYDWRGNLIEADDDAHGFYDRSLGVQSHANANKPYQLSSAENSSYASSTGSSGKVTTYYDDAGNLKSLSVVRSTSTQTGRLTCLPTGAGCNQYYEYDWDEVGRLIRAKRWDSTAALQDASATSPTSTATLSIRYRYDANDQRVIKRLHDTNAANQRHTLYIFPSLETHRAVYAGSSYTIDPLTLVPYTVVDGARIARLHYDAATTVPKVSGLSVALGGSNVANSALHVLFELGDHLGSTGTAIDKTTGELVERTTYLPFGARESDYRPNNSTRWDGFREDYGFTGKEEDVEVGVTYFGKRFYNASLGRWMSPDPLAVHSPSEVFDRSDETAEQGLSGNFYQYAEGSPVDRIDDDGLQPRPRGAPMPWRPPVLVESQPERPILRIRPGIQIAEPSARLSGYAYTNAIRRQLPVLTTVRMDGPGAPRCGYYVGPYRAVWALPEVKGQPRTPLVPSGKMRSSVEAHHGVLTTWAQQVIPNYNPEDAPTILMTRAEHDKTRGNYNTLNALLRWMDTRAGYPSGTYSSNMVMTSRGRAQMVDFILRGTSVPQEVRDEYLRQFETYARNQQVEAELREYEQQFSTWEQNRATIKMPDPVEPP